MTMTLTPVGRRLLVLASVALVLSGLLAWQLNRPAATTQAGAAGVQMFMDTVGQKSGQFPGDSSLKGHTNDTTLLSYSYELSSPRDAATGLPTGRRQHHPVTVTKVLGSNSPVYLQAISTNENLKTVTINFWKQETNPRGGALVNYYRVTLMDASLFDVKQMSSSGEVLEEYSFTFRKITQSDLVHNRTWSDDWNIGAP